MQLIRWIHSPHLIVSIIQIVVAVLGTVGILNGAQSTSLEIGLAAVLAIATSLGGTAVHASITRRQADRAAREATRLAEARFRRGPEPGR
jgi:hypothetical protein